jgi:hypothetical protein
LNRASPDAIADFLEGFASGLEARASALIEMAHTETGLAKEPRLGTVELPRTTNQLRLAAAAVRERSWVQATIDTKANLRSMHGPLGGGAGPHAGGRLAAADAASFPDEPAGGAGSRADTVAFQPALKLLAFARDVT